MSHDITFDTAEPQQRQYWELFESTGWNAVYRVDPADLWHGFQSSWFHVCAYDGAKLVGSGRLLSDGVLYAVFFDIIVMPSHQRSGIGTEIVNRLLDRCHEVGIRDALLFSARGTEDFYRRFGFTPRLPEAPGMILRRT